MVSFWRGLILCCLVAAGARAGEWQEAAEANDVAKLTALLGANAALLNAPDSDGKTALHLAAGKNNFAAARFLVEHGADVNLKSKYDLTAAKLATGFGYKEMADYLRQHGGGVGSAPVQQPAVSAPLPSIASITNTEKLNGFQKQLRGVMEEIRQSPERGFGPLHQAASAGQIAVAKNLLARGTAVNVRDEFGWTPLHWAVESGQKAMVDFLLENKANLNALTTPGDTALTIALVKKHGPIIQTLLDHKPDVNLSAKKCPAPLVYATDEQMTPVVAALLQAGADVNRTNSSQGWTPLHLAAYHNNKALVELLLPHKPKLDAKDEQGLTPLDLAEKRASTEIINLLRTAAGRPALGTLTETQSKLLAAYKRFENIERKGLLPEIRGALFAQEPTAAEVGMIFLAHTNSVAKAYEGRKLSLKGDWERRIAYDRPREEASRVELLPPAPRIVEWQSKGWINPNLPIYTVRVWRSGYSRARETYAYVNERWVVLPVSVLREDPVARPQTTKRKAKKE